MEPKIFTREALLIAGVTESGDETGKAWEAFMKLDKINPLNKDNMIAIDLGRTYEITVLKCNLSYNEIGIHSFESEWNGFINNTISFNTAHGIDLEQSNYTFISYNSFSNNTNWGVVIISGHHISIYSNAFLFNHVGYASQGMDDGYDNNWNSNYWSDWISGDYEIYGSAGSYDYDPLVSNPL